MSVMCLSDGSHWPATTAEYQKKKKKIGKMLFFVTVKFICIIEGHQKLWCRVWNVTIMSFCPQFVLRGIFKKCMALPLLCGKVFDQKQRKKDALEEPDIQRKGRSL